MRWFGSPWGAPVNTDVEQAPTPVGRKCAYCKQLVEDFDQGFLIPYWGLSEEEALPWHRNCFTRSIGVKP